MKRYYILVTEKGASIKLIIGNFSFSKEEGFAFLKEKYPNYEEIIYVNRDKIRQYV